MQLKDDVRYAICQFANARGYTASRGHSGWPRDDSAVVRSKTPRAGGVAGDDRRIERAGAGCNNSAGTEGGSGTDPGAADRVRGTLARITQGESSLRR